MLVVFCDTFLVERPPLQQHLFAIHQWHNYRLQWMGIQSVKSFTNAPAAAKVCKLHRWFEIVMLHSVCESCFSPWFVDAKFHRNQPIRCLGVVATHSMSRIQANLQGASTRGASRRWLATNIFEIWSFLVDDGLWMIMRRLHEMARYTHTNQYNPVFNS